VLLLLLDCMFSNSDPLGPRVDGLLDVGPVTSSWQIYTILEHCTPSFSSSASMYNLLFLHTRKLRDFILSFLVSKMCTIFPVSIDQTSTVAKEPATRSVDVSLAANVKGDRQLKRLISNIGSSVKVRIP
jgi:hypothetical protein